MKDNLVIVTGASSGIGAEIAKALHSKGYNLLLIARREDRLSSISRDLNALRHESCDYRVCDLSDRHSTLSLAQEISDLEVVGVINNAGIGSMGEFSCLSIEKELSQIELNVLSPLILSHAVLPKMKSQKRGFIVNVSSVMAFQAVPYVATYAATKAFELRHSLAMHRELQPYGIHVMTLCPGPTETEFFGVSKVSGAAAKFKRTSPQIVAQICLKDLSRKKKLSIPTIKAKILVLIALVCPISIYTYLLAKLLRPIVAKSS